MGHIELSDLLAWHVDMRQDDWFRKMTRGQSDPPGFLGHAQWRERSSS